MRIALFIALLLAPLSADAQSGHIYIDEDFSDWAEVEPLHENPLESFFHRLWIANDEDYLYLSFEITSEEILQDSNVALWIDSDADSSTGIPVGDMGAELRWHFGDKVGSFVHNGQTTTIRHRHIGIVNAPTVSGTRFEIAVRRDAQPDDQNPLFTSDEIRVLLSSGANETMPDDNAGVSYTFQQTQRERPAVSLARAPGTDFRIVSYNSQSSALFSSGRQPAYGRIFDALDPDFIGFSELYDGTAQDVVDVMNELHPIEGTWYAAKPAGPAWGGNDLVLASRYPIVASDAVVWSQSSGTRTGVFLVDLRPDFDSDLLFFVSHPNCCEGTVNRQIQLDAMMAYLRDWKEDPATVPNTPFMHIGDMNLVTYEYQRRTILDGEIVNTQYFPSFEPDWDGSSLQDLNPYVTGRPMSFTWYSELSDFSPGRLDYIIYSGATLESLNGFNLFTRALTQQELDSYGLWWNDTGVASDHLPMIGDFRIRQNVSAEGGEDSRSFDIGTAHPNPSAGQFQISLFLPASVEITAEVVDILGRRMWNVDGSFTSGEHILYADLGDAASGVYVLRVIAGSNVTTQLITVIH